MKLFTRALAMLLSVVMLSLTAFAVNSAQELSEEETAMLITAIKEQAAQAVEYDSKCTLCNNYDEFSDEDFKIECKAITDDQNLYWFTFDTGSPVPCVMVNVNIGEYIYEFTWGDDVLVYDKANNKLYLVQEAFDKGIITKDWLLSVLDAELLGDSNSDGKLDIEDIVFIRQSVLDDNYRTVTDINGDNTLNVTDIVILRDLIVNGAK